jgi:hypothetical protein
MLFDKFSNKEISPAQCLQLVFLFMSHKAGLNYNVLVLSTITFTSTKIVLMCINCSLHRNDMNLFVGYTEVMFVTNVFGALVRLRLSPSETTVVLLTITYHVFWYSKFCFRSQFLHSGCFQIITPNICHIKIQETKRYSSI